VNPCGIICLETDSSNPLRCLATIKGYHSSAHPPLRRPRSRAEEIPLLRSTLRYIAHDHGLKKYHFLHPPPTTPPLHHSTTPPLHHPPLHSTTRPTTSLNQLSTDMWRVVAVASLSLLTSYQPSQPHTYIVRRRKSRPSSPYLNLHIRSHLGFRVDILVSSQHLIARGWLWCTHPLARQPCGRGCPLNLGITVTRTAELG
jgi:hypothetical protein